MVERQGLSDHTCGSKKFPSRVPQAESQQTNKKLPCPTKTETLRLHYTRWAGGARKQLYGQNMTAGRSLGITALVK